ncbi:MAG: site-specific integrase [Polyangiaceae bacterium]
MSLGDGERPSLLLATCRTRAQAEARRDILAELHERLRASGNAGLAGNFLGRAAAAGVEALAEVREAAELLCAPPPGAKVRRGRVATFGDVAQRWTSGELAREHQDHVKRKRSARDDVSRLKKHVLPVVADIPIAQFTLEHAEGVMRRLPEHLSQTSRRHVAQLLNRILGLCVYPLKLIKATPLPRGWLPRVDDARVSDAIYPDEDAALLAHRAVPLCYRVLLGFLAREGCRPGEAAALTFRDLDLKRGILNLDRNKTDEPRDWVMDPGVVRALVAWRPLRGAVGHDHVFTDEQGRPVVRWARDADGKAMQDQPELTVRAEEYRTWLLAAGVDRPQLYIDDDKRRPTKLRDLRGTFVTTALANGRTEDWVRERTGHKSSLMLARYKKKVQKHRQAALGDLLPLDVAILELTEAGTDLGPQDLGGSSDGQDVQESPRKAPIPLRRRDLKSTAREGVSVRPRAGPPSDITTEAATSLSGPAERSEHPRRLPSPHGRARIAVRYTAAQRTCGERSLGRESAEQAIEEACRQHEAARAAFEQGDMSAARGAARRALTLFLRHGGPRSPDAANTLLVLSRVATAETDGIEAAALARRALGILRATGGDPDLERLRGEGAARPGRGLAALRALGRGRAPPAPRAAPLRGGLRAP